MVWCLHVRHVLYDSFVYNFKNMENPGSPDHFLVYQARLLPRLDDDLSGSGEGSIQLLFFFYNRPIIDPSTNIN